MVSRRELKYRLVLLDAREDEVGSPVYRSIPALASIGKGDHPFLMRRTLADHAERPAYAIAFGISGEVVIECHAVQFEEAVPFRSPHEPDNLPLIH